MRAFINSVPEDFADDVAKAAADEQAGDLALFSYEVEGFEWETDGWRVVGKAQYDIDAMAGAKTTWENICRIDPHDREANLWLGKIHERLDDVVRSTGKRVLLFAGHMLDSPDRRKLRFPADKESSAREKIKEVVLREMNDGAGVSAAYAGGASGGDILFLEVCAELGIETRLYLAVQPQLYITTSVSKAGPSWVERFWKLHAEHVARNQVRVLSDTADAADDDVDYLPAWLRDKPDYNIWERNNLWMLFNALAASYEKTAHPNLTLVALWDREEGDGPGGTGHLVCEAESLGARCAIIDTKELFGL